MIYYMYEKHSNNNFNAGGKARLDVQKILESHKDFLPIIYNYSSDNKITNFKSMLTFFSKCKKIKKGDVLILQNQFMFFRFSFPFIQRLKKKNIKIVFIIHDLNGLRMNRKKTNWIELKMMDKSYIMIHTDFMKEYILNSVTPAQYSVLYIFPYLIDCTHKSSEKNFDFCYAGNLSKSAFLHCLPKDLSTRFCLFGKGDNSLIQQRFFNYGGAYTSDEIPFKLNGKFGLIWDGNSLDGCVGISNDGINADYIRFNSPHKFALYISAGIPVICWKKSGIAEFVINNKLGITIDSVLELRDFIINDDDYKVLIKNVLEFRKQVISGQLFEQKLYELLNINSKKSASV